MISNFFFPSTMSDSNKRRTLSKEELEIHQALSQPASGSQQVHPENTKEDNSLTIDELLNLVKNATAIGVQEGMATNASILGKRHRSSSPVASVGAESVDSDLPARGLGSARKETVPLLEVFGTNVNGSAGQEESDSDTFVLEDDTDDIPNRIPSHIPQKASASVGVGTNNEVEPDADLPSNNPRLPASWNPKKKIISWVGGAIDHEWSAEDRKNLKEKFHPIEDYDHLFKPVKMPNKLFKSIKAPSTKKKDYLLSRSEIEKDLFYASDDLCTSTRPLIEALSLLDDLPNCKQIKNLIGQGLQGIFSANLRISKGRREVGRRFVRLDCAEALYGSSPSHRSLFGNVSDAEAVKQAKDKAKLDESLVFIPKKKFCPANKSFQTIPPWKKFQYQNFQNHSSNYNNSNYNNQKGKRWNPNQTQNQNQNKGRGRGRGTQKNSSNQKD